VKILDGEMSYNVNNLDQYLMGIKKVSVEKKKGPKVLPKIKDVLKMTKADETFYQNYSAKNNGDIID
jgi:hypothetical protein